MRPTNVGEQLTARVLAGSAWQDTGLVFTTSVGTPLDARNVIRRLKRVLRDAGLSSLRFHDLRHSAASLLGAQGVPPRVVMDPYSHVFPSALGDAADAMDRAFGGQPDQSTGTGS